MKRNIRIIFAILIVFVTISLQGCEEKDLAYFIDPNDYEENSLDRFLANTARTQDITFEAAAEMEREYVNNLKLPDDEKIVYCSIRKKAGTISDGKGYCKDVYISTEMRCIKKNNSDENEIVESIGEPCIYVDGLEDSMIPISCTYNINDADGGIRLSVTTGICFSSNDRTIQAFGDINNIEDSKGKKIIEIKPKTYSIMIK